MKDYTALLVVLLFTLDSTEYYDNTIVVICRIFPWHIDTWTETAMEIICHDRCQLRFDLSKPNHGKYYLDIVLCVGQ